MANRKIAMLAGLLGSAVLLNASSAFAAVPEQEAARLGKDLTPLGAVMAGNQEGTIPAWTGGITSPPAGYRPGMHHLDPYAGEKPLFTITAANAAKYRSKLTDGQLAMLNKYPGWKLKVYPTHRSASYPQRIYDATKKNAVTASTTNNGNGVVNAALGIPFPIPKTGVEVIWNHLMRYRGESYTRTTGQVALTAGGDYTTVVLSEKVLLPYHQQGNTIESINNRLIYFLQTVDAPARLAGRILLVHEPLDQARDPRKAWVYNPGQRRVRRAPNIAYDNPGTASDSQRTNDQLDMYNGAPDRYNWKLLGKREIYVPYNAYQLHSDKVKHKDILQPGHINPELLRYELHRVWVVEANVKEGTRHIYAKRVFYVDEDSWQILAVDQYDGRGEIWRVSEAYPINYYDQPLVLDTLQVHYDLQNGRYLANGLNNETELEKFNLDYSLEDFTPGALRRAGRR